MKLTLADIPSLDLSPNANWQVKALVVDGRSPAIEALASWHSFRPHDNKRILKAIRIAAME